MQTVSFLPIVLAMLIGFSACHAGPVGIETVVKPGAYQMHDYLPSLNKKSVALVVNHTSMIDQTHLVDSLLQLNIEIKAIYSPEHGFKGDADAGEKVKDGRYHDIPLYSLYGKNRKPSAESLQGVDIVLFDIQDVGVRFYTYLSTLHLVMEAAAEQNIKVIVLDRPNPNIHYVDGPILEEQYKSFVGMHSVPIVYGMTIGEYAEMINGEGWLIDGLQCELQVITCSNYDRSTKYELPIAPSPNLPNQRSILLYPSLCLFEGTTVSVGRGTNQQFQLIGHPNLTDYEFTFKPVSNNGAKYPKHQDLSCTGLDLTKTSVADLYGRQQLNFSYLVEMAKAISNEEELFINENNFFEKLAGTKQLRLQLMAGASEDAIRSSWQSGLEEFELIRQKYLIYN